MSPAHAHARRLRRSRTTVGDLIAALRRDGCRPREAAPGLWIATCPLCKLRGRPHAIVVFVEDEAEVEA